MKKCSKSIPRRVRTPLVQAYQARLTQCSAPKSSSICFNLLHVHAAHTINALRLTTFTLCLYTHAFILPHYPFQANLLIPRLTATVQLHTFIMPITFHTTHLKPQLYIRHPLSHLAFSIHTLTFTTLIRRRRRHPALSVDTRHQQAAAAGIRQADDLLSAQCADAGGYP